MNIEISKELLSAILDKEVTNIEKGCTENELKVGAYFGVARQSFYISINELEKKCLRWGWGKGYSFEIIPFCVGIVNLETYEEKSFRYTKKDMQNKIPFLSKYTFIACQWILDKQK